MKGQGKGMKRPQGSEHMETDILSQSGRGRIVNFYCIHVVEETHVVKINMLVVVHGFMHDVIQHAFFITNCVLYKFTTCILNLSTCVVNKNACCSYNMQGHACCCAWHPA